MKLWILNENIAIKFLFPIFSPVWAKLHIVIQVINVPPAVDVYGSLCCDHQDHERQFNQVADLHQQGGGDERHHSHEAVVFGVSGTASVTVWFQHRPRGAVWDLNGWWDTAELQHHDTQHEPFSEDYLNYEYINFFARDCQTLTAKEADDVDFNVLYSWQTLKAAACT